MLLKVVLVGVGALGCGACSKDMKEASAAITLSMCSASGEGARRARSKAAFL